MLDLNELRLQIDDIDKQMIELFEKRMNVVQNVAKYKQQHKTNVLQNNRELEVIEKACANIQNKDLCPSAKEFMQDVMDISKNYQRKTVESVYQQIDRVEFDATAPIGYFGDKGSNSEVAMIKYFDSDNGKGYDKFEDVFLAVENGEIAYGVVPIENSSTGAINDVYDLLKKHNLFIVGEVWNRICHNILGVENCSWDKIDTIYSHSQAIAQCDDFLKSVPWNVIACESTARAGKIVAQAGQNNVVAIANERTAELYNLHCIKSNISTFDNNYTRFIVIGKNVLNQNNNKVSICFEIPNTSGSLAKSINYFAKFGVNLVMIESRPIKNDPLHYCFYIDMEGSCNDKNIAIVLEFIEKNSTFFKLLGEYKKGDLQ